SLLDLDLPYGNASTMLGLPVEHTLADLADGPSGQVSSEALADLIQQHQSGVRLLTGCDGPERAASVGGLLVRWAIERTLEVSDVVLIDTSTWWSEATMAALA